jgi:hypothetical protein
MDSAQHNQDVKAVLEATLEPFVQQVFASFGLAGLAIGIVKTGELVYAQGVWRSQPRHPGAGHAAIALPPGLSLQDIRRHGHCPVG